MYVFLCTSFLETEISFRGIILFAMLNGRLPFNDAQLSDLEEDMKMQRLRFERAVSFGNYYFISKCFFVTLRSSLIFFS